MTGDPTLDAVTVFFAIIVMVGLAPIMSIILSPPRSKPTREEDEGNDVRHP